MDVASMVSGKIHCLVKLRLLILAESVIRTQVALNKAVHRHVSSPFMNGHDDVAFSLDRSTTLMCSFGNGTAGRPLSQKRGMRGTACRVAS